MVGNKPRALPRIILIALLVIGVGFRYLYNTETRLDQPYRGDGWQYLLYAKNILEHSTFSRETGTNSPSPDSYWSPGFPLFLAMVIKVSEWLDVGFYRTFLHFHLLLGGLTILLTYLLAKLILPGFWPALPTLLVAFSPHLVSIGANLLSETLTGCLLLSALYFCISGAASGVMWRTFFGGCFFALSYITNPVTAVVAPILTILLYFQFWRQGSRPGKKALSYAIILLSPLIIAVSLWTVRASINVPADAPKSSARLLTNLAQGADPQFHAYWRSDQKSANSSISSEIAAMDSSYVEFLRLWRKNFADQPLNVVSWYLVSKPILLWAWDIRVGMGDIYVFPVDYSLYDTSSGARVTYSLMKAFHPWILTFALLSLVFILYGDKKTDQVAGAIFISILSISAIYIIAQSEPRYSLPLRAEMYILGTYFIRLAIIKSRAMTTND